jgi:serine/threonine-protein kinase HipA
VLIDLPLIKTSAFNNETKTYHVEAVMECLASDIGRLIGVTIVDYWLDELDRLIVFDYLIDNYDRHMRNVELLSMEDGSVRLAPLFDNGSSLLADWVTEQDLPDLEESEELFEEHIINAETQSKCFAHDHRAELMLVDNMPST